ncbi:sensor histidine kinase [Intrasporangium sp.]|uniref:sensor histidine kinase n=1 Tax=Intrasporangium sp. TaxID=1925024 RepID=UPI0032222270
MVPAARGSGRLAGSRLRALGIVLPVAFVVALEVVRSLLERKGYWSPGNFGLWRVSTLGLVIIGIVVFSVLMFRLIDRAERQVLSQNRDLTTANAVAAAIQGESSVAAVADGALRAILGAEGAVRVAIRLFDAAGQPPRDEQLHEFVLGSAPAQAGPSLDVPMSNGPTTVGRLAIWYPAGADVTDRIGGAALSSLTTQIACAVQLADAVWDLNRRQAEGHAFYDILLRISHQEPTTPVLDAVAKHAVALLDADAAAITVTPETTRSIGIESDPQAAWIRPDGAALVAHGLPAHPVATGGGGPAASDAMDVARWTNVARRAVPGGADALGEIWVARSGGTAFSARDRGFLAALASLVGIALTGAQMREGAKQREVLNERARIAREMHDSLAQVLGAVHLRLRALGTNVDGVVPAHVAGEVEALADVCAEAYRDVREAILGLRAAHQHASRSLEDNLSAYLGAYSAQSGVAATLVNEVGHEVSLSPRAEVQVLRIVQEALTNVRKHARAGSVTVSIRDDGATTSVVVQDDGVGFDAGATLAAKDGYGLGTMCERAALLGGTVDIDSTAGRGTAIRISVPERPYAARGSRGSR